MTYLSPQTVPSLGLTLDTYSFTIASTHRDMTGIAIQANVSNEHGFNVQTFTFNILCKLMLKYIMYIEVNYSP